MASLSEPTVRSAPANSANFVDVGHERLVLEVGLAGVQRQVMHDSARGKQGWPRGNGTSPAASSLPPPNRSIGPGNSLATGADLALAVVTTSPPTSVRTINAYIRRLHAAAAHDPVLTRQFLRVSGLLAPPAALMKPTVAMRVLIRNLRRPRQ